MIVRFFNTGTSNGESPVRYLLSATDHEGNQRPHAPEILEGSPALTIDIINSIERKHKYASGCLAFRPNEQPTRQQLLGIVDAFKAVVAPGLSADQFNALFVLHQEPPDKKTGLAGFHVHFVLPMTILGGTNSAGKNLTGRRWNPHPPGKQTIEVMSLFTQITNHEHNWKQVQERPQRLGLDSLWLKSPQYTQKQKTQMLHKEVLNGIKTGGIKKKADITAFMEDTLGLTVTRTNTKTVSVKFPGDAKAVKLKGAIYETGTDLQHLATQGSQTLTLEQYAQAKETLTGLLRVRAQHTTHAPITTRRRDAHGKRRSTQTATAKHHTDGRAGSPTWRATDLSVRTSGLERDLLSPSRGQWRHSHVQSHQADGPRTGNTQSQVQPTEYVRQSPFGGPNGRGGTTGGRKPVTSTGAGINTAATLDEKIRALTIELDDCVLGSLDARAITDELSKLQGERSRLPQEPAPTKRLKPR
ncbi:MAG: hypothetical protein WBJ45_11195 [Limnohabitans sp.]|uniref:hypothetical protein n=1 Tax=Limnohabitans sp. TaxID=1907725 RepID=UPI003BB1DDD2